MAKNYSTFTKKSKGDKAVDDAKKFVKRVGKERAEAKALEVKEEKKEFAPVHDQNYYQGKYVGKVVVAEGKSTFKDSFILESNAELNEVGTGRRITIKKGQLMLRFNNSIFGTMDGRRFY